MVPDYSESRSSFINEVLAQAQILGERQAWQMEDVRRHFDANRRREQKHPCRNCLDRFHRTEDCGQPCGHCGQDWHTVDACTSSKRNRCRCRPFPQRHLVKRCPAMCNPGECPAPHAGPLVTAMMCKSRCCMCGIPGHAGRDCHLKTCRCGGQHLTVVHMPMDRQCAVVDCPRFFCTRHCQVCRADMAKARDDEACQQCQTKRQPIRPPLKPPVYPDGQLNYEYLEAAMAWGNSIHGEAIFGKKVAFNP
ncbi:major facilitator superfamily transporter [Colletotrichum incanum]|uniref:Major facilitator superfamily transporter n=1 Tax=Colletotrichum incanum TaxID=1573173 RepID=A0A166ZHY9_COLIC|nr:major facilitator superfamily transporter [Colletotrichum incanum]OHW95312.1 hypothetical protein CSPAE12_06058 [Colletotrichum incanum]